MILHSESLSKEEEKDFVVCEVNNSLSAQMLCSLLNGIDKEKPIDVWKELFNIRNKLVTDLPTGDNIQAFDVLTVVKDHTRNLDFFIDKLLIIIDTIKQLEEKNKTLEKQIEHYKENTVTLKADKDHIKS